MKYGYYAKAKCQQKDDKHILYVYYCYDNNQEGWEQYLNNYDGSILIEKPKDATAGIDIFCCKVKRASGWWEIGSDGIGDMMAVRLIRRIGESLKTNGEWPAAIKVFVPYNKCGRSEADA